MSRMCTLYVALSLDGYLADREGGVDWLNDFSESPEEQESYVEFLQSVDTIVMGRVTYEQIKYELAPNAWPYPGKKTYVIASAPQPDDPDVEFWNEDPASLIRQLKAMQGRGIWINGGAQTIQNLVAADVIDVYYLTVIPCLLGDGIHLFPPGKAQTLPLRLRDCSADRDIVTLIYSRRKPGVPN